MKPTRIIWHHTADNYPGPQAMKVNLYHKSRGFPKSSLGFYGGYHYLIETDGFVFQYRQPNEIGAHDKDENFDSIGICLAGNFNVDMPTDEQKESAAFLLKMLLHNFQIPPERVFPHRTGDSTDCPGRRLADDWIVKNLKAVMKKQCEAWAMPPHF